MNHSLAALLLGASVALLTACGGGDAGSAPNTLQTDRQTFESFEAQGGSATLGFLLPYGGGPLISGTHHIYATSSGGLAKSPATAGAQTQTPVIATALEGLAVPAVLPSSFYLHNGRILPRSATAQRRVSYTNQGIQVDQLADDGSTVLQTLMLNQFRSVALAGALTGAPAAFLAMYPLDYWAQGHNLSAGAQWQAGAAYASYNQTRLGDTIQVTACNAFNGSTASATAPKPCFVNTALDASAFPINLLELDAAGKPTPLHPFAHYAFDDGVLGTLQGVPMWTAKAPQSAAQTDAFQVFFALNNAIYAGVLRRAGGVVNLTQTDGSVVDHAIRLNQAALGSIRNALVQNASPGSTDGSTRTASATVDLYGVGGTGVNGALAPADLRQHYNVPAVLDGSGQTVAVINAPSQANFLGDLNVYSQKYNLPGLNACNGTQTTSACLQIVCLSAADAGSDCTGSSNLPTGSLEGSAAEATLDIQMVHAMAPRAKIVLVLVASPTSAHPYPILDGIHYAARYIAGLTAVSVSYHVNVDASAMAAQDPLFQTYVANQGLALFASTGDAGNAVAGTCTSTCSHYPAKSPSFTAVGGTEIVSVNGQDAPSEKAWTFTGGGSSAYAAMPAWQNSYLQTFGAAAIGNNNSMRAYPDVAAVATRLSLYRKQQWQLGEGTSAATPIWAGLSALLAQQLARQGAGTLGALIQATPGGFNGLLYQARARPAWHDISTGQNNLTGVSCLVCTAGPGYDNLTGLGAPDAAQLFNALTP